MNSTPGRPGSRLAPLDQQLVEVRRHVGLHSCHRDLQGETPMPAWR
jgi:hypothetical protein